MFDIFYNSYNLYYHSKVLIRCRLKSESILLISHLYSNNLISNHLYDYYMRLLESFDSLYCIIGIDNTDGVSKVILIDVGTCHVNSLDFHKSSNVCVTSYGEGFYYYIKVSSCYNGYEYMLFHKLKRGVVHE